MWRLQNPQSDSGLVFSSPVLPSVCFQTFYRQVSSPLLRQITIQFPEDSVTDVTQNRFDKFFDGSELVVSGKVLPSESTKLTSIISAYAVSIAPQNWAEEDAQESRNLSFSVSQASLDINLVTEADVSELDMQLAKHQHSFTGFAKQMWAYLTIKQLISERWAAAFYSNIF